jgi:hypothetical protein
MNCEVTIVWSKIVSNAGTEKMKNQLRSICTPAAKIFSAALAGIFLLQTFLRAQQPAERPIENRFLFIFDTSSDMRRCESSERSAIARLFAHGLNGQIQPGDSIGVWTFAEDVRAGQFPLQRWSPQNAATISSNILAFIKKQRYTKTTSFVQLTPLLQTVVGDSARLTILIFCDGDGQIRGTPFDETINGIFKENQRALHKAREPFVLILRSQFGQYVNYMVDAANGTIQFPQFPPPPAPPVTNSPPKPPPPKPLPVLQPLIIIGTTVTNRLPPALTNQTIELSNQTSAVSAPPTNLALATNAEAAPPTNSVSPTNAVSAPPENSSISSDGLFAIGAGFLIVAGGLLILILRRLRRRNSSSLITRSMKKD